MNCSLGVILSRFARTPRTNPAAPSWRTGHIVPMLRSLGGRCLCVVKPPLASNRPASSSSPPRARAESHPGHGAPARPARRSPSAHASYEWFRTRLLGSDGFDSAGRGGAGDQGRAAGLDEVWAERRHRSGRRRRTSSVPRSVGRTGRCVYAADRRSPRGQAEAAGSHAVAVQRRDEVRTPPGNCRALHAAASVQIATATGEARACRLCGMADDPAGTTAGRQEASTFALSWSNSA